jgi:hypothetical protein
LRRGRDETNCRCASGQDPRPVMHVSPATKAEPAWLKTITKIGSGLSRKLETG